MTKKQVTLLINIFLVVTAIATISSVLLTRNGKIETAQLFVAVCVGSAIAAFIIQLFYWIAPNFGAKPTREELEKRIKGQ